MAPSDVGTSKPYTILTRAPAITPDGGHFLNSVEVRMGKAEANVEVFWTLDGTTPSATSSRYTGPILLQTSGVVVSAIAIAPGQASSHVNTSRPFIISSRPPTIEPDGGSFTSDATVVLASPDPDASVYYTTDGSTPSQASVQYHGPFPLSKSGTFLQAVAVSNGRAPSSIVASSSPFVIGTKSPELAVAASTDGDGECFGADAGGKCGSGTCGSCEEDGDACRVCASFPSSLSDVCATPRSGGLHHYCKPAPDSPDFSDVAFVSIQAPDPTSAIYYTTDGSEPSSLCPSYRPNTPIEIRHTHTVVKAIAVLPFRDPSPVSTSRLIIIRAQAPTFSPDGGTFVDSTSVSMSSPTPGARVHYSTDGSDPTAASPTFSGRAVEVGRTGTELRAVAVHADMTSSEVSTSGVFAIKAATPTIVAETGAVSVGSAR
eukprot:3870462-Rhodomonas_salina.2